MPAIWSGGYLPSTSTLAALTPSSRIRLRKTMLGSCHMVCTYGAMASATLWLPTLAGLIRKLKDQISFCDQASPNTVTIECAFGYAILNLLSAALRNSL